MTTRSGAKNQAEITGRLAYGWDGSDAYPMQILPSGRQRVNAIPYSWDIAEGNVPDHASINKFGHNAAVAATLETIWGGSTLYSYMSVADQLEILSSNDEDGGAGTDTGALTMEIFGLDTNYIEISEMVTLNGLSVVTSVNSYLRVYRAIIRTAGSTGWNIGGITIRDQDIGTTRAFIESFDNQTLMALYTIPAGRTGFVTAWYAGTVSNKATEVVLAVRPFGEVFQSKRHLHLIQNLMPEQRFTFPEEVGEKSDVEIRAQAIGGGGDVSAGFCLWHEL